MAPSYANLFMGKFEQQAIGGGSSMISSWFVDMERNI